MKRILTTIIALWSVCTMAGLPPTTLSGEQATTKPTTFTFEAPNYQGTQISGIKSRVETGNTNLLVNPSFEHSTVTTGWTITNATASADTTNQVEGKKALSLSLTGALDVYQDSTVNAANLVGLQGNASIKIKTSDVDGLKVCARNAGVTSTSLCINIPKDGVWKEINIPNILTATSNGIAITSTGTTGTVKLDDAFVGTSAPFQGVNGAKLVGTLKYAAASACSWTLTSTTFANYSADTDCSTPTVTGAAKAPATKIPAVVLPQGSQAGTYYFIANGAFYHNNAANGYASYRFSDGTNHSVGGSTYATNSMVPNITGTITLSSSLNSDTTFNIQAKVQSSAINIEADPASDGLEIAVYYFPPESKIYSQASQDFDWVDSGLTTSTSGWQGFGTLSAVNIQMKRKGGDLYLRGTFTQGTPTSTEFRIPLPTVNGQALTIKNGYIQPSMLGHFTFSQVTSNSFNYFLGASASGNQYINLYAHSATVGYSIINTTGPMPSAGATYYIESGPIPISQWSDYGVVVGSFVEVPMVPGQNNVEEFTFSYGATATTNCTTGTCAYLDKIGNGVSSVAFSSTGNYLVTFAKTYASVKCEGSVRCIGTSGAILDTPINCTNCSSATLTSIRSDTSVACNSYGTISCKAIK